MERNTVSGMILIVLLSSVLILEFNVQPVEAQTREVGVQVGDWARYDVACRFTTNDPSYLPEYQPEFAQIEYFRTKVLSVTGTNITFQATKFFKNGTEMLDVLWIDVSSSFAGSLPVFSLAVLFTAANLTVGDSLLLSPMSPLVNATSVRFYAGEERDVNFVNRSRTGSIIRVSPPREEYIDESTTCMFLDRATGVLVEANETSTHCRIELDLGNRRLPGGYVYETETCTQMVMEDTNMWRIPFVPFWLEWWFYVAVVVVVASLGGVIYLVRKRKSELLLRLG